MLQACFQKNTNPLHGNSSFSMLIPMWACPGSQSPGTKELIWGSGLMVNWQQCPGSWRGQLYPGLHQSQHCWPVKRGDCPAPHCPGMHSVQFWASQHEEEIELLETIQGKVTKVVKSLEDNIYKEWLKSLGLFSLERGRLMGDIMAG